MDSLNDSGTIWLVPGSARDQILMKVLQNLKTGKTAIVEIPCPSVKKEQSSYVQQDFSSFLVEMTDNLLLIKKPE